MKIFWSWQSDTDGRIGRFLVRDALRDAVGRLKESLEIDEPVRDALHIDHDIQGVSGSPDLVPTILAKIDSSEVVIADVTVVGKTVVSTAVHKGLINSNVAIELGYALHAVGDRQVVLVFNQHYGTHEDLPFDLRHKGGAIVFTVSPDADREQIKIEQKQLADRFVNALKPYIQKAATLVAPVAETPSTFCRASYFERTALLAKVGEMGFDQIIYSYNAGPMCYLRLVPASGPKEPIRLAALKAAASIAPLLSRGDGAITEINDYGAIRIEPETYLPKGRSAIKDSTQLFENGEIWSISMGLAARGATVFARRDRKRLEKQPSQSRYNAFPIGA